MNQYDHFKDKLHDYKVKVDKEKLWERTSHAIPQRRRRRIILLFFMGMILVSGLIGYSLRTPEATPSLSAINQLSPVASNKATSENLTTHTNLTTSENSISSLTNAPQEPQPVNHFNEGKTIKASNASNRSIEKGIIHESKADKKGEPVSLSQKQASFDEPQTVLSESQNLISMPVGINHKIATDELELKHSENTSSEGNNVPSLQVIAENQVRTFITPSAAIPGLDRPNSLSSNSNVQDNELNRITPASSLSQKISFSVLAAIGLSSLDFKALNNESEETTELFKQNTRSLEHLSLDVAGRLPLSRGFSVQADLGLNRWTTETKNLHTSYQPFISEGVTNIIIDENGVQQPVLGLVNGMRTIRNHQLRYTYYHTIDVNLSVYKTLWHKRRMFVDVYAQGTYVIADQAHGSTYNEEGELIKFSKEENPFRRASSFGIGGGLHFNYNIGPHLAIQTTFGCAPVKYNWLQGQQQIELTHSVLHGHVGMSYQL